MVAQKGKDLLLKLDPDGLGSFVSVAGLRSRQILLNAEPVDVTDSESAGRWRELIEGAGARRASVTGSGIFKDAAADETVRQVFFDGSVVDWKIIIPQFGELTGKFQIITLEYSGDHNAEVRFEMSLESAGIIAYSVAP